MSYGGPHGGFMACKEKYMRQLPGRIEAELLMLKGKQHLPDNSNKRTAYKREKATSNICSNQALMALCATLYLTLMGKKGFSQ